MLKILHLLKLKWSFDKNMLNLKIVLPIQCNCITISLLYRKLNKYTSQTSIWIILHKSKIFKFLKKKKKTFNLLKKYLLARGWIWILAIGWILKIDQSWNFYKCPDIKMESNLVLLYFLLLLLLSDI